MAECDDDKESFKPVKQEPHGEETDNLTITLIRLVRERTCLYNKVDRRYNDRYFVDRAWEEIAAQLGEEWTKEKAKEKWTRLRNSFSKVLFRRQDKSGSFTPWLYENDMEFLKRHITVSRASSLPGISRFRLKPSRKRSRPARAQPSLSAYDADTPEVGSPGPAHWFASPQQPDDYRRAEGEHCESVISSINSVVGAPRLTSAAEAHVTEGADVTYGSPRGDHLAVVGGSQTTYCSSSSCARTPEEEPLLLWFKSLLPVLKTLSPQQMLSFQISSMQELQRLTSDDFS